MCVKLRECLYAFVLFQREFQTFLQTLKLSCKENAVSLNFYYETISGQEILCDVYIGGTKFGSAISNKQAKAKSAAVQNTILTIKQFYPTVRELYTSIDTFTANKQFDECWDTCFQREIQFFVANPLYNAIMFENVLSEDNVKMIQENAFQLGFQSSYKNNIVTVTRRFDLIELYNYLRINGSTSKYIVYIPENF